MTRVLRLPENTQGRDFVTGDIHGCFSLVDEALTQAGFEPEKDRLIVVGDLVDRGPESAYVADFVARPYVYSVRGNHDDVIMNLLGSDDHFKDLNEAERLSYLNTPSMAWIHDLDENEAIRARTALESLPYVIEIDSPAGPIGFVHADVPDNMSWPAFTAAVEAEDVDVIVKTIYSRKRIKNEQAGGVEGAARVFCGHTPRDHIQQRGNFFGMDTGAVFNAYKNPYSHELKDPHLTLAQINLKDAFYTAARPQTPGNLVHLIVADAAEDLAYQPKNAAPETRDFAA